MKNTLNHFYKIYAKDITKFDYGFYFYVNDYKYYLFEYNRSLIELNQLVQISNNLYNRGIMVHTFITTYDGKFMIEFENKNYVLLRVNCVEKENASLLDIIKFNKILEKVEKPKFVLENWSLIWSKKVDLLEKEMTDLNKEYIEIQKSFDYYVGLAENAISYANNTFLEETISDDLDISLNHKRVSDEVCFGYLYNPLTFTFDYCVRDIAEYLKSCFFSGKLNFDEFEDILKNNYFSSFSLRMLYARLLYPSYYFDLVENIFLKNCEEDHGLQTIYGKTEKYEDFLFDIGILLKKYCSIPLIDWIVEKNSRKTINNDSAH